MDVKGILSRKGRNVLTVEPTAILATAVKVLTERKIGALVVTGEDDVVAGIISERDIVRALAQLGSAALSAPVAQFMTSKVVTGTETLSDIEIMKIMTERTFRHVPVSERGRLTGIVSIGDVVKARVETLENKLMNLEAIVAAIAHEVRQPLAAISTNGSAALRFLGHARPNIEEARAALIRAINDAHRTSDVFDSIRSLFRDADAGKHPLAINDVIVEVFQSLDDELKERGIHARFNLAPVLPLVTAHRGQLQQVMRNLVRNAVEAMSKMPEGSRSLEVRTKGYRSNAIEITLKDSGPGIARKQLKTIFDAFVTTKAAGIGLGLAICRLIVERHGGQISASSDHKGGTRFRVLLPIPTHQ
jgi:signal transduction histidine kinase